MSPSDPGPDLGRVTGAFTAAGARFVVIGGFAVIAHDYVRATEDVDLLVPDGDADDERVAEALAALGARWADGTPLADRALHDRPHSRLVTDAGLVDLLREGEPPLDFATVAAGALRADLGHGTFLVAGLRSVVALKRLAGRPRDRLDLEELRARHGDLPVDPVPGLDVEPGE
jgi:hypothetical protein